MNFSSAKKWAQASAFSVVPFRLTQSIDFKTPLVQLSVNVLPPPNPKRLFFLGHLLLMRHYQLKLPFSERSQLLLVLF